MQPLTSPAASANHGPQAARGRWIWRLSGTVTIITIGVFGSLGIVRAENPPIGSEPMSAHPTQIITVAAPVTALNVQSYGAPIKVTSVPGAPVQIAETISYVSGDGPPTVTDTDSGGLLTLAAPACANSNCSVAFTVTVPSGVTVSAVADGGSVTVAGTGAAHIDSGGGPVQASSIVGPLTVTAEGGGVQVGDVTGTATIDSGGGPVTATGISGGLTVQAEGGGINVSGVPTATIDSGGGPVDASSVGGLLTVHAEGGGVQVNGVTGTLYVDTGGGPMSGTGITSQSATVTGEGGNVTLGFTAAPVLVHVDTGDGSATLSVPGGPYAVTADTGGATESVLIATSPSAARSITVSTEGGNLQIGPASAGG